MQDVTLIGIDLSKHSFHLHGQDRRGRTVRRKKVTRKQPIEIFASFYACIEVMESCAGEHYTAPKLARLEHGSNSSCRNSCAALLKVTRMILWMPRNSVPASDPEPSFTRYVGRRPNKASCRADTTEAQNPASTDSR